MANTMKKLLSLVLAAIMVLSMIPAVSAAEETEIDETFQISKLSELTAVLKADSAQNLVANATYKFVLLEDITVNIAGALYIGDYVSGTGGHGVNVIIDLNNHTITDAYSGTKNRLFAAYEGSSLTIMNGKIVSNTAYKSKGGVFFGEGGSDFTFNNVTVEITSPNTSQGGVLFAAGSGSVVTLTDTTFTRKSGDCADHGGMIAMSGGQLNLNNSHISGGRVVATETGDPSLGGNIYLEAGAVATMNGGSITNGYVEGKTATDIPPASGGNVYVNGKSTKFILNSGTISGGEAKITGSGYCTGGNVGLDGDATANASRAYFVMNGGEVINGKVTYGTGGSSSHRRGANFGLYEACNLTINGGLVQGGDTAYRGTNIDMWTTNCAAEINGGTITDGGIYITGQLLVKGGLLDQAGITIGSTYVSYVRVYAGTILHSGGYSKAFGGNKASSASGGSTGWVSTTYIYGGKMNFEPQTLYGDKVDATTGEVTSVMYRGVVESCSEVVAPTAGEELYVVKHKDNDTSVTVPATCTEKGSIKTTCTSCDFNRYNMKFDGKYTYEIPALGHTAGEAVTENQVANSCTVDGSYDTVVYCTLCNAEISRETSTVPALGHTAGEPVIENETAATCDKDGSYDTVVYCTVCNAEISRETTTVAAAGHTPGEEVIENKVENSCTADGSYDTVVYCTVCNAEISRDTTTVSAAGHTAGEPVVENEVANSCTADGSYDTVVYCTVCNAEISRDTTTVSAAGHTAGEPVVENEVANSCTADGSYDTVTYCTVCSAQLSRETTTVPAAGHTEVTDAAVAPDCVNTGLTEGKHCSVCGTVTEAQEDVPELGHKYEGVKTEATFEADAFTTYTCSVCGDSYVETEEGTKLTAVATADGVPYETLQEALNAGGNVVLLADGALTESLEISAGKVVTLDLNGKVLSMEDSSAKGAQLLKNNGDLTIMDSQGAGKLTFHSSTPSANNSYSTSTIINVGELKIVSGTVENTTNGGPSYAIDNAWYTEDVTLSIEGGVLTSQKVAVRQVLFSATARNTINIKGGILDGSYAGLQLHNYSKSACLSDVTITGGTFNGDYAFYTSYSYNNTAAGTNIAINGGEFNGYVYLYNGNAGSDAYPMTISVTGGTFNYGYYAYCLDSANAMVAIPSVTGGTHIYDVTDYCVEGYGMHANGDGTYGIHEHNYESVYTAPTFEADGFTTYTCATCDDTYTVVEEGSKLTAVATADGISYETLQAALAAGGNVVLLQDLTATEKLTAAKTATLDLGGKTLTLANVENNYALVVSGQLKIVGEGEIIATGAYGIGVTGYLTIENGTFKGVAQNDYIVGNFGTTVINGGNFQGIYNCVNNFAGTTAIYGGTFTTAETDYTGEYEAADILADAGLTVYGGTYSKPVEAAYCAEGVYPKANEDGTYTVVGAAAFAADPASVTAKVGETVQFTAVATGDIIAYRWEYSRDGVTWYNTKMEGVNTDTLTVPVLLTRDGYQYRCVVTDAYGNGATSQPATLTVEQPTNFAQITQQPAAQTAFAGESAIFAVEATGDCLTYQWQYSKNGTKWYYTSMTGYNTATLTVNATLARNGYQYRCVITDSYGTTVTSEAAALTVTEKEITTAGPQDQVATNGTAVFTVNVEGEGLTYRWQYQRADGTKWFDTTMAGYNTNTLTVIATAARDGYKYRCIITDANGNKTVSQEATLTVRVQTLVITGPTDQVAKDGEATFTVVVEGEVATYCWQYQTATGTSWSNATDATGTGYGTATLTVAAKDSRNGYKYRCVITDVNGNEHITEAATLTVK